MSILRKGEISTEFIMLIGLLLVIFTFMIMIIGLKNRDISDSMIDSHAQKIVDTIASEINIASRIEGYYREFEVPEKITGSLDYTINVNTDFRFVQVKWINGEKISNIVNGNVSGNVIPGTNKIRNDGGMIIFES